MTGEKGKVVVIWSDDFPSRFTAFNEKNSLLAKAFMLAGYDVVITSISRSSKVEREISGITENIYWLNFCRNQIRLKLVRNVFAIFSEMRYILSLKLEYKKVYLISSYCPFPVFLFYSFFSKIFKIKLILNIMEWHIAQHDNASFIKRLNAYLFDKYAFRLSKGTIAISEMIISKLKNFSPNAKFLLIPALTDIRKVDEVQESCAFNFQYVLYCGGLGYAEVIEMILDSFEECGKNRGNKEIHLVLILHGKESQFERLKQKVTTMAKANKVHILRDLKYADLIRHYKNASALLVPLRNNEQDKARYPQKIAEYSACGRPIISTQTGQVGLDFTHKTDIYFMTSCSSQEIAKAMKEIIENKEMALTISSNARIKAETHFDYKLYSRQLDTFLKSV
jgi:glycosyltransferase involved in cell wall biosynthesis